MPKDFKLNEDSFTKLFGFSNIIENKNYLGYSYTDNLPKDSELGFDIDIEGYKHLIYVYSLDDVVTSGNYKFEKDKKEIKIYKKSKSDYKIILTIDMAKLRDNLKLLKKTKERIAPEDLEINKDGYKVLFTNIYFGSEDNLDDAYIEFYLLTK